MDLLTTELFHTGQNAPVRDGTWVVPELTTAIHPGERVRLRHRFVFFVGNTDSAALNAAFEVYALEKR